MMLRIFCRASVVFVLLALPLTASKAQTPLGQPTLDEQKVQVWCATAQFVYEDNGRPNLKNTLRCGGSLKNFENSIRADSQRVFSALYQPLEGRSVIYKGLLTNPARLQKLKTEIVSRLKSSAARRRDPARMQRLAALEVALNNYVLNGTPISVQEAAEATTENPAAALATDEAPASASAPSADAGPEEAGIVQAAEPERGNSESLINKFFAPLALIMALLSLVLYGLMRRNMSVFQKELSERMARRQDEIMASRSASAAPTPPQVALQHLSPELQHEVELLVQQRVEAELTRRENTPTTTYHEPIAAEPRVIATPVAEVIPVPTTMPLAPEASTSTPDDTLVNAPSPLAEAVVAPVELPVGSADVALRDDFDALVPPIHLPDAPAAPSAPSYTRYGQLPVGGLFRDVDFTEEPLPDSIYEIYLDLQWPELATFQVSTEPAVQAYLLPNAPAMLAETCDYKLPAGPITRIVTEEEGILRKVDGIWHIEQKARVLFEEQE